MSASLRSREGGFGRRADVPFGYQDRGPRLPSSDLAERMDAEGVAADAPFRRLLGQFGLGDQVAGGRIRARERDAGGLADKTASAVASDEILRPQRPAIAERDVDASVVLGEARHLNSAMDGHRELFDPAREDPLDVALPQPEPVRVAGRKVADVERAPGEAGDLRLLALGDEPTGNAALIEHLDRA